MVSSIAKSKRWAYLIGIGIALFPLHNQWLTDLVTEDDGEVGFFLPSFGAAMWILGALWFINYNWDEIKQAGLGDKKVYIPLMVIAGSISLSGLGENSFKDIAATIFVGPILFSLYIAARLLGKELFYPLAIGAIAASVCVFIYACIHTGEITGGYMFEYNYDIVIGYLVLGAILFRSKYQWALVSLVIVAAFLSGSPEGVFVFGIGGLAVIIRRDFSMRFVYTLIPLFIVAATWFLLGYGQDLYSYTDDVIRNEDTVKRTYVEEQYNYEGKHVADIVTYEYDSAIGGRWDRIVNAKDNFSVLGDGYEITQYNSATVHNVPLIIVQQLGWAGILAGLAWIWVVVYCLIKTKWKYAFIMILALSVFDHFIFTQMAPMLWLIIGVAVASDIKDDLIFKGNK